MYIDRSCPLLVWILRSYHLEPYCRIPGEGLREIHDCPLSCERRAKHYEDARLERERARERWDHVT